MGLKMTPPYPGPPHEPLPTINAKDFDLLDVFGADEGDGAHSDPTLPGTGEANKEFTAALTQDGTREDKIALIRDLVSSEDTTNNRKMALNAYQEMYGVGTSVGGEELSELPLPMRFLGRLEREWRVVPDLCRLPESHLLPDFLSA